ncbi:hypothetical protein BpHYR1_004411 [Brachionus plicatilis]|uniref:Uncharacterized protein n=1 Tax=Brachionus plicatilis TaxID=10195 RepID=A0A3M7QZ73_BRAPC|nr:hypothetical protein BpHYR1_004411 [Brachionus plicatilis]
MLIASRTCHSIRMITKQIIELSVFYLNDSYFNYVLLLVNFVIVKFVDQHLNTAKMILKNFLNNEKNFKKNVKIM